MTPGADSHPDTPAAALGAAWNLLDVLPRSSSTPSMTSTTLEMVAASAAAPAAPPGSPRLVAFWRSIMHWALPAAAVIGGLFLGFILGRATLPPPERRPGGNLLERIEQLEQQQRQQRERAEQWRPRPPLSPQPGRPNGRPAPREMPAQPR